jgi:2-hydroxy-3-keto-5-methylthiopentenyl-1-phosphate phosphatase
MLDAPLERLTDYAIEHCPLDPTFAPFVDWLARDGVPVTLVSDGFGFYIAPILRAAGLDGVRVLTNAWSHNGDERIVFANAHPECIGCGTCKMNAVLEARAQGPVVFVGEGASDRYGALYADLAFAKDRLVEIATADGVPFERWESFNDVRAGIEALDVIPGPVASERCPGWRTP